MRLIMARASASKAKARDISRGSGNLFADLGFRDAEERQTKLRLANGAFCAPHSHASQAIEPASESPCLLAHVPQALPWTRFSVPNDALRSRKTSSIAISLPQRAQFSPQDSACSRVICA
jgi:hypothetical protein